jgi:hypothetical protein
MRKEFLGRVAKHFANELAVVTPNGTFLSKDPAEALKKWKKLPTSKRKHLEDLGKYDSKLDPSPPPNGLIINVYARSLRRGDGGRFEYYRGKADSTREAGRDHLWLTESEWQSLLPTRPEAGHTQAVSGVIVDRLCLRYLITLAGVGGFGGPRSRDSLYARELHVTVEQISPESLQLRLHGSCRVATARPEALIAETNDKGDYYQLLGYLKYDVAKKAITRFDLIAFSETGYYDTDSAIKLATPLAIAFQLSPGQSDMDRFPPFGFSQEYFADSR